MGKSYREENKEKIAFTLVDYDYKVGKNKTLKIVLIIIFILVIVCISITILYVKGIFNFNNQEDEHIEEITNIEKEEEKKEEKKEVEDKRAKIPVYSEEAKQRMKDIYTAKEGDEKCAYLTFDDGPSKNITPQILDILKEENVKATFFILGSRAELSPELVKREYEEGHYIANHGYSHIYKNIYASKEAVLEEYNHTENIIKSIVGEEYSSHLFRFPGGSEGKNYKKVKTEAKALLAENNIEYINWNSLTNDAVGKPTHESLINDLKSNSNR